MDPRNDPLLKNAPEVKGYKVLRPAVVYAKIGQGGMGAVYRGKHLNLDVEVAVKCLKTSLAEENGAFVVRFQREAKLAAGIQHENLIRVFDVASEGGLHYLVMEYVAGESARERVERKGPLGDREAATLLLGAARGLAAAHKQGIVHRDVKPDNVLISRDGVVKVADLGIARSVADQDVATLTHGTLGTPQYTPPEQWADASKVGPAADVWALGATAYFLLTGTNAIRAGSFAECARLVCDRDFPDVRHARSGVDPKLAALLQRCTERDPERRPRDAAEVARELSIWLGEENADLADAEAGSRPAAGVLVSPPPATTIAEIKVEIETRTSAYPAPENWEATVVLGDSQRTPKERRKSKGRVWVAVASSVLLGCAGVVGWNVANGLDERVEGERARPAIRLDVPLPEDRTLVTAEPFFSLQGTIEHPGESSLRVEFGARESPVELGPDGSFALLFELEANRRVPVRLALGDDDAIEFELVQDSVAPELELVAPAAGARRTSAKAIELLVALHDDNPLLVRAGAHALAKQDQDYWRATAVALPIEGENRVSIVGSDRAGHEVSLELTVVRDTLGPRLQELLPPEGAELVPGSRVELRMVFDERVTALGVAGEYLSPESDSASVWLQVPPGETTYEVLIEALDDLQNLEERVLSFTRSTER